MPWPEDAKYALQKTTKNDIPSVLDADLSPDSIAELVKQDDRVAFPESEMAKFSGTENPREELKIAQKKTNAMVYVTVGSKGCYWLENNQLMHQAGKVVKVVNTTGA